MRKFRCENFHLFVQIADTRYTHRAHVRSMDALKWMNHFKHFPWKTRNVFFFFSPSIRSMREHKIAFESPHPQFGILFLGMLRYLGFSEECQKMKHKIDSTSPSNLILKYFAICQRKIRFHAFYRIVTVCAVMFGFNEISAQWNRIISVSICYHICSAGANRNWKTFCHILFIKIMKKKWQKNNNLFVWRDCSNYFWLPTIGAPSS